MLVLLSTTVPVMNTEDVYHGKGPYPGLKGC